MRRRGLSLLVLAFLTHIAVAQPPEQPLPEEAQRRLAAIIGTWDSTWMQLNPQGEVVRSFDGVEKATWAIAGRVVLLSTEVPSQGSRSQSFMYYSEIDRLFHLTSVDSRGDLWLLSGGLDEYVITSEPKARPNGGEMIIRFTHDETDTNNFSATMETSIDSGATWRRSVLQKLTRRSSP